MQRYQRPRIKLGIGRLIIISLILYGLYHWYFKDEKPLEYTENQSEPLLNPEQLVNSQQIQNSSGFFSIIFSLIALIPRLIWTILTTILGFFWWIIHKIWLIKVAWNILMSIVNVVFICFVYFMVKRQHRGSRDYFKFFGSMVVMVIIPLIINRLLVDKMLAYYIFLPIDLTLFVDSQGRDGMFYYTMPRNLVVFTFVCSLI